MIIDWIELDSKKQCIFKKGILTFIRPIASNTSNFPNSGGLKILAGLRLTLNHLLELTSSLQFHKKVLTDCYLMVINNFQPKVFIRQFN